MATKIIVSYDGTDNDHDALALGRLLAGARRDARARLRPPRPRGRERARAARREATPRRCSPAAPRRSVSPISRATSSSAPRRPKGCAASLSREQADVIVFGSEYRTARGHVDPQASARRLLDGGPVAVAIAPAGFAEQSDYAVEDDRRGRRGGRPVRARDGRGARRPVRRRRSSTHAPAASRLRRRRLQAGNRQRPGDDQRRGRVPDRADALPGARAAARRRRCVRLGRRQRSRVRPAG